MEVRILTFLQLRHNVLITQHPLFMSGKRELPFILQKQQVFPEEDNILCWPKTNHISFLSFIFLNLTIDFLKGFPSKQKDFVLDAKGSNNYFSLKTVNKKHWSQIAATDAPNN